MSRNIVRPNYDRSSAEELFWRAIGERKRTGFEFVDYDVSTEPFARGAQADLFLVTMEYNSPSSRGYVMHLTDKCFCSPAKDHPRQNPWEDEYNGLVFACNTAFKGELSVPFPKPIKSTKTERRDRRHLVREYLHGTTLDERLKYIDQEIAFREDEVRGLEQGQADSERIGKLKEELYYLGANRQHYVEASIDRAALVHTRFKQGKTPKEIVRRDKAMRMFRPSKTEHADDVEKHMRSLLSEERGFNPENIPPNYLAEVRAAYLRTESARYQEESRGSIILNDLKPDNILSEETEAEKEAIEAALPTRELKHSEITGDLDFLDAGKIRVGSVYTDLGIFLFNRLIDPSFSQFHERVLRYEESVKRAAEDPGVVSGKDLSEAMKYLWLCAPPILIHAADSDPVEGSFYLSKLRDVLNDLGHLQGIRTFKDLLAGTLEELVNGETVKRIGPAIPWSEEPPGRPLVREIERVSPDEKPVKEDSGRRTEFDT